MNDSRTNTECADNATSSAWTQVNQPQYDVDPWTLHDLAIAVIGVAFIATVIFH